jgi:hypothetical protein
VAATKSLPEHRNDQAGGGLKAALDGKQPPARHRTRPMARPKINPPGTFVVQFTHTQQRRARQLISPGGKQSAGAKAQVDFTLKTKTPLSGGQVCLSTLTKRKRGFFIMIPIYCRFQSMVEMRGLEPLTSALRTPRSPG